jgi:hypothetical protein
MNDATSSSGHPTIDQADTFSCTIGRPWCAEEPEDCDNLHVSRTIVLNPNDEPGEQRVVYFAQEPGEGAYFVLDGPVTCGLTMSPGDVRRLVHMQATDEPTALTRALAELLEELDRPRPKAPPVECAPWCRHGDGHPNETHPDDQWCQSEESRAKLQQRTTAVVVNVGAVRVGGHLFVHMDYDDEGGVDLTIPDARGVARILNAYADLAQGIVDPEEPTEIGSVVVTPSGEEWERVDRASVFRWRKRGTNHRQVWPPAESVRVVGSEARP